jgi:hypothetical protein
MEIFKKNKNPLKNLKNAQKPEKRPVFGRHVFSDRKKKLTPKNKEICKKILC